MIKYYLTEDRIKDNCCEYIKTLDVNKYQVEIKEISKTDQQRDYWHRLIRTLANEVGYTEKQMKIIIKDQCDMVEEFIDRKGKVRTIELSSERLSKKKYSELIDKTFELAGFANVRLPQATELGLKQ